MIENPFNTERPDPEIVFDKTIPLKERMQTIDENIAKAFDRSASFFDVFANATRGLRLLSRSFTSKDEQEKKDLETLGIHMLSSINARGRRENLLVKYVYWHDQTGEYQQEPYMAREAQQITRSIPAKYKKYTNGADKIVKLMQSNHEKVVRQRSVGDSIMPVVILTNNEALGEKSDVSKDYKLAIDTISLSPVRAQVNRDKQAKVSDLILNGLIDTNRLAKKGLPNLYERKSAGVSINDILRDKNASSSVKKVLKYAQDIRKGDVLMQNMWSGLFFNAIERVPETDQSFANSETLRFVHEIQDELVKKLIGPPLGLEEPDIAFDKLMEKALDNLHDESLVRLAHMLFTYASFRETPLALFDPKLPQKSFDESNPVYVAMLNNLPYVAPELMRVNLTYQFSQQFWNDHIDEIAADFKNRFHSDRISDMLLRVRNQFQIPWERSVNQDLISSMAPGLENFDLRAADSIEVSDKNAGKTWEGIRQDPWAIFSNLAVSEQLRSLGFDLTAIFVKPDDPNIFTLISGEDRVVITKTNIDSHEQEILTHTFSEKDEKYETLIRQLNSAIYSDLNNFLSLEAIKMGETMSLEAIVRSLNTSKNTFLESENINIDAEALAFMRQHEGLSYDLLDQHGKSDLGNAIRKSREGIESIKRRTEAKLSISLPPEDVDDAIEALIREIEVEKQEMDDIPRIDKIDL